MSASPEPSSTTIAVIGAGRLGGVLATALRRAGSLVHGPFGRDDTIPASDVAILCVPDAEIPAAAHAARPYAPQLGHVSGATP
jgi:prephenate dehydrogenase